MFGFEKLDVWHKAVQFSDSVYHATQRFPAEERFGLTNQMRRASISISSNIAEGSSRASRKDFGRYVEIAYGSLMETVSQMYVAKARSFITAATFQGLYGEADRVARMLSGLKKRLAKESR